jgi:hypothetical protein
MIYEYAVDPGLLNSWERFRYLTEKFGVSHGRLISRFPKRWKALVHQALGDVPDIDKARIVEKLKGIDDKLLPRFHEWVEGLPWIDNAVREHAVRPFHAIVCSAVQGRHPQQLAYADLEEALPLWAVGHERVVQRVAAQLAAAVAPLLRITRSVMFIDPHFDPYKARVRSTVAEFIAGCVAGRGDVPLERVEFHTEFRPEINDFAAECQRQLARRIPTGITLRVVRWREFDNGEGLHNRYILTERGGLRFAWGLDEGAASQTDDVSLLDQGVYQKRWNQFFGAAPAFEFVDEIFVKGTR